MTQSENYEKLSFEEAMIELESVVSKLDSGEGTLDESISLFQKGVILSKLCSSRLEEIEKKVMILTDNGNDSKKETAFGDESIAPGEKE